MNTVPLHDLAGQVTQGSARLHWITVSLFTAFAALYVSTALGRIDSFDGEMMYRVTQSLFERHSLVIVDEIFHSNEPYSVYGLGTSLFAIPFYVAARELHGDPRWFVSLVNPFTTAAAVTLVYYVGRRFGFSAPHALFVSCAFGLGSLAWPYTKTFFSEPLTTLWLLVATATAVDVRRGAGVGAVVLAGLALGLGTLIREDSALTIPLFVGYLLWPGSPARQLTFQRAAAFASPLLVLLAITWWYHDLRFHSLLSGYVQKTGNAFDWSLGTWFAGTYGLLVSSGKGLVFYSPVVLLSVVAWRRFWSSLPLECALFSALVIQRVLFFAFLLRWYGGVSWGPRYIVPTLPFLIIPIGFLLASPDWQVPARQAFVAGLFVASVLAQLPGVAINYALYWNATINTKTIILDQILYSPHWSPLTGQFYWMLRGQNVQWLLPLPDSPVATPLRMSLAIVGVVAFGAAIWLNTRPTSRASASPRTRKQIGVLQENTR